MKKRRITGLFASVMMLFAFYACKTEEPEPKAEDTYFTVTFDTDGGSEVESQSVLKGEKASVPEEPSKTGYSFSSWQKNGADYDFTKPVTENITLKAVWTAKTYTVTLFNEENPSTITATYGQLLPDLESIPEPNEGETFSGFYSAETRVQYIDETGKGSRIWDIDSDATLIPLWGAVTFTITYEGLEGAENPSSNPAEYTKETETITLSPAVKDGYTFAGWSDGNGIISSIPKGSTGNKTYYARWRLYLIKDGIPQISFQTGNIAGT